MILPLQESIDNNLNLFNYNPYNDYNDGFDAYLKYGEEYENKITFEDAFLQIRQYICQN